MRYTILIILGILIYLILNNKEGYNKGGQIDCSKKDLAHGCDKIAKKNCERSCNTGENEDACNNLKVFFDDNVYPCIWENDSECHPSTFNFSKCKQTLEYGISIPVTSDEKISYEEASFIYIGFGTSSQKFLIDTGNNCLIHPDYNSIKDIYKTRRNLNPSPISSNDEYLYKEPWGGDSYLLSASNIKIKNSEGNITFVSDFKFYAYIQPTSNSPRHTTTNLHLKNKIGNFGFDYKYIDYNLFYAIPNVNFVELNLCNGELNNKIVLYEDIPDPDYKKFTTIPKNKYNNPTSVNFINIDSLTIGNCSIKGIPFCIDSGGELPFINNPRKSPIINNHKEKKSCLVVGKILLIHLILHYLIYLYTYL